MPFVGARHGLSNAKDNFPCCRSEGAQVERIGPRLSQPAQWLSAGGCDLGGRRPGVLEHPHALPPTSDVGRIRARRVIVAKPVRARGGATTAIIRINVPHARSAGCSIQSITAFAAAHETLHTTRRDGPS